MRILTLLICISFLIGCSRNAITGRNQITVYSDAEIKHMAAEQYRHFLETHKVVDTAAGNKDALMIQRVGWRLSIAVKEYYKDLHVSDSLDNYSWEFNLVESKQINLWSLPGGKVVVYTGLLPITVDDDGLAIILAHALTHDLARHIHPRMMDPMARQLGGLGLSVSEVNNPMDNKVSSKPDTTEPDVEGLLPFNRRQELEADELGLQLAAMAGYDPLKALNIWERIKMSYPDGRRTAPFIKIHPIDNKRIAALKTEMTKAAAFYHPTRQ